MKLTPRRIAMLIGGILIILTTASAISSLSRSERKSPEVGRVVFGGIPRALHVEFYIIIIAALVTCTALFVKRMSNIERGSSEHRAGKLNERINALYRSFAMRTVSRDKRMGRIHSLIYWPFVILTLATITLEIDHQLPANLAFLHGHTYEIYSLISDLAGALLLIGVVAAALNRYVWPQPRIASKTTNEDAWILTLLALLVFTGFLVEADRIAAAGRPSFEQWSFVGYQISRLVVSGRGTLDHQVWWVVHVALFIAFLITLPVTKLRHAVTAPANAYLSPRDRPKGEVREVPLLLEGDVETVGAGNISQFSWKQLLDTDACTWCGRCTSVCPANQTGKTLDPREIILKIGSVMEKSANGVATEDVTALISAEEVFACTTCKACDEICPVEIEIMDKIVDIRRHYTLMESAFPSELGNAYVAMENSENPWGMPSSARLDWAQGLGFELPIAGVNTPLDHEYLYWVGCAGSFDDRAKQTTRAVATLLNRAGVDFAVLGPGERCTGDPARRSGNEYLFQVLATQNIATLNGIGTKKIITNCPHCFNTLANEYGEFGGNYEVIHHSQLLRDLLDANRIPLKASDSVKQIVFHDSCYLTRHNDEIEAPRRVVGNLKGIDLIEAPRNRNNNFCCGAGGAQMWMEETQGIRINLDRTSELLATGAQEIAVACPYCAVMIDDAVKATANETPVKDIAQLLLEHLAD
jgi:Fe-S oxidoreductase/nitrate reductase gamma subunit